MDLAQLFATLQLPAKGDGQRYSAEPIPGYLQHRIAKDSNGNPSLLLAASSSPGRTRPPLRLENLSILYNQSCMVTHLDGSSETGKFTVSTCTSPDPALQLYFLRILGLLVEALGPSPTQSEIAKAIDDLIELFSVLVAPPRESVQGLWAELYLIARSRNPAPLIGAWHSLPEDRYDFNAGNQRVEVKSVAGSVRQHHFSLEQLHPPAGSTLLIASIFVERAAAGASIADLIAQISAKLNSQPDLILRLEQIVLLTLGSDWRGRSEDHFDRQRAEQTLTFFEPDVIPSVNPNLPDGVSSVKFISNLTGKPAANPQYYRSLGGIFQAL